MLSADKLVIAELKLIFFPFQLVSAMVAAVCATGLGYAAAVPYAYKQYPYAPAAYYGKRSAEAEPEAVSAPSEEKLPYAPAYYGKRSAEATGCRNFVGAPVPC